MTLAEISSELMTKSAPLRRTDQWTSSMKAMAMLSLSSSHSRAFFLIHFLRMLGFCGVRLNSRLTHSTRPVDAWKSRSACG